MTSSNARPFVRVVRLADLDNLYEAPSPPSASEPLYEASGTLPDAIVVDDASNDGVGPDQVRESLFRTVDRVHAPQPIGSTMPGALPEAEVPAPAPRLSREERRRRDQPPVRDVPRLPHGEVRRLSLKFDGQGADYARIWFGNVLLLLLTAGLAWPWTHRRSQRYFLQHTVVAGHRLDFRLSPRALWPRLGMVLALWLGVAGATAGSWMTGLLALTLGGAVWPLMSYLSIDQRVGSVSWAGRRLWFDGPWQGVYKAVAVPLLSGLAAIWCVALGLKLNDQAWLVGAAALGVVWLLSCPLAVWGFLHYRQHHVRLGPLRLKWKASRGSIAVELLQVVAWSALMLLTAGVVLAWGALMWQRLRGGLPMGTGPVLAGLAAALALCLSLPYAQASLSRAIWNKTGNRHLRVRNNLSVSAYVRLYAGNALRLVVTLGLYWPWAAVALWRQRTRSLGLVSRVDPEVLLSYWSRRQTEGPPTLMSAPPHAASAPAAPVNDTQPSVLARTGTLG